MMKYMRSTARFLAKGVGATGAIVVAAVGGWIVYSALGVNHNMMLPAAVDAERTQIDIEGIGKVNYYVDRAQGGRPLVLVHSINAAASAFEMKPLFEHYRTSRPVYVLELPGYGFSDRSDRRYSPALFVEAIGAFLQSEVGEEADVIALSLSSEFAASVALAQPSLVRSLALISPTGFGEPRSVPQETSERIHGFVTFPLWSQALYDLLALRPSIAYFLNKNFAGSAPSDIIEYAYLTSHQPGAKNAPFYFLSTQLFTWDIRESVYEQLETPTVVLYDQDPNVGFEMLPTALEQNVNLRTARIAPSFGLPHWEHPTETAEALDEFWRDVEQQALVGN